MTDPADAPALLILLRLEAPPLIRSYATGDDGRRLADWLLRTRPGNDGIADRLLDLLRAIADAEVPTTL
ncbi:MAG: hypothetical protein ABI948_08100 [Thermoleophilia bacterium]